MSCSCSVVPFILFVPCLSLRCPKRRAGVSTAADAATCRESAFKRPDPVPAIYVVPRTTGVIHSKLCHFLIISISTPHILFPNHKCCRALPSHSSLQRERMLQHPVLSLPIARPPRKRLHEQALAQRYVLALPTNR